MEEFWARWNRAVTDGDGRALWGMTSASDRKKIVEKTRAALSSTSDSEWERLATLTAQPAETLKAMSAEQLAEATTVAMLSGLKPPAAQARELTSVDVDGERAKIRFSVSGGRELTLHLVRENGAWAADLEGSAKTGGLH